VCNTGDRVLRAEQSSALSRGSHSHHESLALTPPREWIDKNTGHYVARISDEPNSCYFNYNGFTPQGDLLLIETPAGIAKLDLRKRKLQQVIAIDV
jgi:hypothetical protein